MQGSSPRYLLWFVARLKCLMPRPDPLVLIIDGDTTNHEFLEPENFPRCLNPDVITRDAAR